MTNNGKITKKIKNTLTSEKEANDKYSEANKGSSIGQWRINQLNTCTRQFKMQAQAFQQSLTQFNSTITNKNKRQIGIR